MVLNSKRRRSSVAAKLENHDSVTVQHLQDTVKQQQSALSAFKKDLVHLQFIVEHLNKDAQCILKDNLSDFKSSVESQTSLLTFISAESSVLARAELEAQHDKLQRDIELLQGEHKILIEQQVFSEEAMMDELARLMTENEALKQRTQSVSSPAEVSLEALESAIFDIESEIEKTATPEVLSALHASHQKKVRLLRLEVETRSTALAENESIVANLMNQLSSIETEFALLQSRLEMDVALLQERTNSYQQKLSETESVVEKLQNEAKELKSANEMKDSSLAELISREQEAVGKIEQYEKQLLSLNSEIGALHSSLSESKALVHTLQQQLDQSNAEIEAQKARTLEQFDAQRLANQLEELNKKYTDIEEAHGCLLDIVKEKEASLNELQISHEAAVQDNQENEQRVRELVSINAELMDVAETSKKTESIASAKDEQISALQIALSECSKLAELRGSELERIRNERTEIVFENHKLTKDMKQIFGEKEAVVNELTNLQTLNSEMQLKLNQTEEQKAINKSEVIMRIELEKLKDTLSRERKLNELKVIDLEEQVECLRAELSQLKTEGRKSISPTDNETENIDPFKEAKDKLAQLGNANEPGQINKRVLQSQGQPPQECLQQ